MEELKYLLENPKITKYGIEALGSTTLGAAYRTGQYLRSEKAKKSDPGHLEFSKELTSFGLSLTAAAADYAREVSGKESFFDSVDYSIILSGIYTGQTAADLYHQEELDEIGWRELLKK